MRVPRLARDPDKVREKVSFVRQNAHVVYARAHGQHDARFSITEFNRLHPPERDGHLSKLVRKCKFTRKDGQVIIQDFLHQSQSLWDNPNSDEGGQFLKRWAYTGACAPLTTIEEDSDAV